MVFEIKEILESKTWVKRWVWKVKEDTRTKGERKKISWGKMEIQTELLQEQMS